MPTVQANGLDIHYRITGDGADTVAARQRSGRRPRGLGDAGRSLGRRRAARDHLRQPRRRTHRRFRRDRTRAARWPRTPRRSRTRSASTRFHLVGVSMGGADRAGVRAVVSRGSALGGARQHVRQAGRLHARRVRRLGAGRRIRRDAADDASAGAVGFQPGVLRRHTPSSSPAILDEMERSSAARVVVRGADCGTAHARLHGTGSDRCRPRRS